MTRTESSESQAASSQDGVQSTERRSDMNYVQLVGRLVANPELRRTGTGLAVTRFRVATNVRGTTEFHSVVAWRRPGELIARQFKKGQHIKIDGALHASTWKTESGETRRSVEVLVTSVYTMPTLDRG